MTEAEFSKYQKKIGDVWDDTSYNPDVKLNNVPPNEMKKTGESKPSEVSGKSTLDVHKADVKINQRAFAKAVAKTVGFFILGAAASLCALVTLPVSLPLAVLGTIHARGGALFLAIKDIGKDKKSPEDYPRTDKEYLHEAWEKIDKKPLLKGLNIVGIVLSLPYWVAYQSIVQANAGIEEAKNIK